MASPGHPRSALSVMAVCRGRDSSRCSQTRQAPRQGSHPGAHRCERLRSRWRSVERSRPNRAGLRGSFCRPHQPFTPNREDADQFSMRTSLVEFCQRSGSTRLLAHSGAKNASQVLFALHQVCTSMVKDFGHAPVRLANAIPIRAGVRNKRSGPGNR